MHLVFKINDKILDDKIGFASLGDLVEISLINDKNIYVKHPLGRITQIDNWDKIDTV